MNYKYFLKLVAFALLFITYFSLNAFGVGYGEGRDNPSVIIHDTVVGPGELLLQLDALNFTGDNGQVSAISLKIDVDTNLIEFIGIQNTTLLGNWLANYNYLENEISIIYTAFSGNGYDINGKLLDLHLYYNAGFDASLDFKDGCEISNVYLQTIQNVVYNDGLIEQVTPLGNIGQDSVVTNYGDIFVMPVIAEGVGYDSVNGMELRVGYDSTMLIYQGLTEAAISGIESLDTNSVITFQWQDTLGFSDFTVADTLFYMKFVFVGDTVVNTSLLPGSKVYNAGNIIPSLFFNGKVTGKYWLDVLGNPDTAGTVTGEGYYFEGDSVTVSATPVLGFHFGDWLYGDSIVSYDSLYTFVKEPTQDTLVAEFIANFYQLLLFSVPATGGTVIGDGIYQYGDSVTVVASPNLGYNFIAWTFGNDTVSYDSAYTFIMPYNNMGLTAVFQIKTFNITVMPNNPDYGTVTGGGVYNYGDSCFLVATPNMYYSFIVWTENGQPVSYDSVYSFVVDEDRELIANFQYDAACSSPVGLCVDSLSDSTAMLHWLPSGEESEWDLLWGEMGFDTASSGNYIEGLFETQYFLQNLTAGSNYDFYVRAVCTDEIHSVWAGPYTFTTWYVGVHEKLFLQSLLIFPNPAKDIISISFKRIEINTPVQYEIVDFFGQTVKHGNFNEESKTTISIKSLASGIYFIRFYFDNRTESEIFVKQ